MIVDHELELTHLGRCGLPPVRLCGECSQLDGSKNLVDRLHF